MARTKYDRVDSDSDSNDSETEDEGVLRTSGDVRQHDQETLATEEEAEKMLAGGEKAAPSGHNGRSRRQKRSRSGRRTEKRALMYQMEEGGPRSSSAESSGRSSERNDSRVGEAHAGRKSKRWRSGGFVVVYVLTVLAFGGLLYGAWRLSTHGRSETTEGVQPDEPVAPPMASELPQADDKAADSRYTPQTLSNGTHKFAPTTILISLDGFRADFLHRNLTKTLTSFVRQGVSPKYMLPSFPSLTFPNHFTLVTGLHPESHGIVGNSFFDPVLQKEFHYTDPTRSMQPEWWDAEPIWVTAEKNGVKTGVHMWPGSEVTGGIEGVEASYVDKYNGDEKLDNKVRRILGWLDLPSALDMRGGEVADVERELRPQLIAAYVPDVDSDGHAYGPNSTYIKSTIAEVDGMLASLFDGISDRNLTDIVNIIIVSDHGMATTSVNRLIQLEDLVDISLIEHIDGWPLYGLRPWDSSPEKLQTIYNDILERSRLPKYKHAFEVYLRDTDMPERYHFSKNNRIAPLWLVPKAGWAIVKKEEFEFTLDTGDHAYHPRGLHGYDNQHPLMRAIFVARGPAFPHLPGSELAPFQNTEVYNIVCDSLGLEPVANNGTLRLPLKPSGVHDFDAPLEIPEDPQDDGGMALPPEVPNLAYQHDEAQSSLPPEVPNLANRPDLVLPTDGVPLVSSLISHRPLLHATATPAVGASQSATPTEAVSEAVRTRPVVHDGITDEEQDGDINRWWSWVTGKIEAIKVWSSGLWGASKVDAAEAEQPDKSS
ncbi:hypothetical protein B0A54_04628 [Friedmanniomyces endolithicus]|uniref:Phosphodiest-domain-containing protein n=1 Tax=Friedmanniomyces endolithicus TaxID=329885 RepID=A0A4U0V7G1_9PEZI|nr:hypothetical protein LTS09_008646 [Friedmanniomyces endolithicus]TKA44677.1 hypothetical protein B0A54_04628 [Friedmanniomyces endolithicus]